ncbi:M23 family metallopeptidase [bacterium]|nr:M23 family metallopeptidase [bacterium]
MKKRKLKGFVLPTVYVLVIGVLFLSISALGNILQNKTEYSDMVIGTLRNDGIPVVKEEQTKDITQPVKPFTSTSVSISKSFYDMTDDDLKQQNSLVYYEKTYLQNSGVLYVSQEQFDIVNVLDGKVTNVGVDDILGNFVEVTHNTNLKTIYYSLGDVLVKKDDEVKANAIIALSGSNKIEKDSSNSLLFEVYLNGVTINPEDFYNMNVDDLK